MCTRFEAELVAALTEAAEARGESHFSEKAIRFRESNGDGRNLLDVEFAARGITGIPLYGYSLMKDLKLPSFDKPLKLSWPPPQPAVAASAPSALTPEELAAARAEDGRRKSEYYANQTRKREAAERANLPSATKKMIAHCANKSAPGRRRLGNGKRLSGPQA